MTGTISSLEPLRIEQFQDIAASLPPQTVVIAGGDRLEDLLAYRSLCSRPFVKRCILAGDEVEMRQNAATLDLQLSADEIVGTANQEETARQVVELIQNGTAGVVLKGNISTPIINRQMLKVKSSPTMSLVTVFQADCIAGGRPIILTDPGVSTVLNFSRLSAVIQNAAQVARRVLGIACPRVALLSGNEKVIASLASSTLAADLTGAHWEGMTVYGPLSFDLAIDPESVRMKGIDPTAHPAMSKVAGQADVLACPNLDSANILYKVLMRMVENNLARMAGITIGVQVPYIITSRSDPEQTKLDSVALCCIYAARQKQEQSTQTLVSAPPVVSRDYHILAINPGSTSAKLALFRNDQCLENFEVQHKLTNPLRGVGYDQEVDIYIRKIEEFLRSQVVVKLDAVVGRGGFLCRQKIQIDAGVYQVARMEKGKVAIEKDILAAVRDHSEMEHASNLGIGIAARLSQDLNVPAFTVDPVVCDEFTSEAQISGYAEIQRRSIAHVLSLRAMARKASEEIGRPFDKIGLVLGHLGGGITIAAFRQGKIVDNTIALLGGGPFTPQRAGTLPTAQLIDLCFSGKFTRESLGRELSKKGGLISYLGTDDILEIERRIQHGDAYAQLILHAMAYQISKEIGSMAIAAGRQLDGIVLSGGIARSRVVMDMIRERIGHLAPVMIYRENLEMAALAQGALRALRGEESPMRYKLSAITTHVHNASA